MSTTFRILLLAGLVICAVATALVRKPMRAVIIYMAYSIIMSVVWLLLESPDLAITEAIPDALHSSYQPTYEAILSSPRTTSGHAVRRGTEYQESFPLYR